MMKKIITIFAAIFVASCAEQEISNKATTIDDRMNIELERLGFTDGMPELPPVFGPYEPSVVVDKEIYITASAPYTPEGTWITGLITEDTPAEHMLYAAELSLIQALNRIRLAAGGDLNNIAGLHHVVVMTTAPEGYPHVEMVAQATSDMIIRILGPEVGAHERSILRSISLPVNMTHETEIRAYLK
jgi:hypothetical protein